MNLGKAFPGGVDGRTFRAIGGALLTVEPTHPGDRAVALWAHVHGEDRTSLSLIPREVRGLMTDLTRRLAVIDPQTPAAVGAPAPAGPAAAAPSPPGSPLPPAEVLATVLRDMTDHAGDLTARQIGDETAARIRGWIDALALGRTLTEQEGGPPNERYPDPTVDELARTQGSRQ